MRRGLAIVGVAVAVLAVWRPGIAFADIRPQCPSLIAYDLDGQTWAPSDGDVAAVRAPIQMRTDGLVCSGGPVAGFALAWIGIENSAKTSLVAIGFDHFYDSNLGTGRYCRFWATDGSSAHDYGCGNTA